jgi:hypothetical protein
MTFRGFRVLIALVLGLGFAGAAAAAPYSKLVLNACATDYKKYCQEYGLETAGLKVCMDRNGMKLSKTCVNALLRDGHVSQAEVDRRHRK